MNCKSIWLYLVLVCITTSVWGQSTDTKHVITHKRKTVTTKPAKGQNPYPAWGVFPSENEQVRKIMMHVTLGTPDSLATAHWDYCDHITIRRAGGKNAESKDIEIGRMLTPYGSVYSKGWEFKWSVDVTDFSMVLRDSVEIEYIHSGYEPTTVGWALTIDFEITPGPPHIKPLAIQNMWNGSFRYGDPEKPIEQEFGVKEFTPIEGCAISRFRIQHTGHGMDQPKGCSEFCSRWRAIQFDGEEVHYRDLWKNCGDNPLYPQGGTWIFDRGLWCPGDLQQPDIVDVNTTAGKHQFTMTMEPYTASDKNQPQERVNSCLIQYSAPVNKHDVELVDIITPNDRPLYRRSNPRCYDAKIKIRNLGSENLKSLTIVYSTEGFKPQVYKWKGDLPYYASEEIILPGIIKHSKGPNRFTVTCNKPNGRKDAWEGDNTLTSSFTPPKSLPQDLVVKYRTNFMPQDNDINLVNFAGDTLFQKLGASLAPDSIYTDTLHLPIGAYEMALTDTAGNGLEFWFMKKQGTGYLRLFDMEGHMVHCFENDCGDGELLAFNAVSEFKADTENPLYDFIIYPRWVKDVFALEVYTERTEDMEVVIMTNGVPVERHQYVKAKSGFYNIDISHLKDQRYIVEIYMNGVRRYKARISKSQRDYY